MKNITFLIIILIIPIQVISQTNLNKGELVLNLSHLNNSMPINLYLYNDCEIVLDSTINQFDSNISIETSLGVYSVLIISKKNSPILIKDILVRKKKKSFIIIYNEMLKEKDYPLVISKFQKSIMRME